MTTRQVETEAQRTAVLTFVSKHKLPMVVSVSSGRRRSIEQNKLQRLWLNEIAEQLDDQTREEWRAYAKLTIGVPILRAENEAFREQYDAHVRHLPYASKLALMAEPLDMPVTRLMTVKQKAAYLDQMHRHFAEQGVMLTEPNAPPLEVYG